MKSQTIGKSESCKTDINGEESYCVYYAAHGNNPSFPPGGLCYYNVIFAAYNQLALFRYKNAPENGEGQDSPKNAFPSAGFENLRIQASTDDRQGWPDAEGRYWWQLTLEDRSINRDFYWTKDKERGYPDKNDNNRYWFIIHGPNGIKIEGFSWEADREHGFPDRNGDYWRYVQYTECGPIKKWMQEKHLRYLARMGDVKAKFELAQRYHKGDKEIDLEKNIIEKDTAEAIVWYEKAAALGSVEAYLSLGDIYVDGDEQVVKDVSKAIGWYEKAADLKSIEAYLALGGIYADGDEKMTKDMRKAIGYYKKAADLKSAEAYLALGQIYANGDGDDDIPIDEKVAIDYFRKAAELGDEEALSELKNFADTRNREALCALECTAARHGPNKYKAQKYLQNSEGRHFFDPQRCAPEGEDDCVASPSIAIILGTTLGLIGLMVLILWWYKTPQTSEPDIREISEEDIETAIQNEDFAILNALLSDEDAKKDMRAWSFIGLDREELYLDDEGLLIRGIIFDKETLLQTTRNYLDGYKKNPDVNPLYLRRLFWGINRLLQTQRLSSKEILSWQAILNRLEDILEDELSVELETDGIPLLPFHRSHHDNSSRETKDNSEKSNSFLLTPSAFFALSSSPESATLMSNKGEKEDVVIQQTSRSLSAHELIKDSFLCPITQEIMFDPVIAMDGYTYEREAILEALHRSMLSPMTRQPIESSNIISNHNTRSMIREFLTQYPEYWQEVYVSKKAVNELLALSSGTVPLDLPKWEAILRADSRLLTLPLNSVTLLEFLCEQKELMVTTYLPALLNLLKPVDWQALIQVRSAEDWQVLVTQACERCSAPSLKAQFLHKLQSALEVQITPLENSLMHEKMVYKRA